MVEEAKKKIDFASLSENDGSAAAGPRMCHLLCLHFVTLNCCRKEPNRVHGKACSVIYTSHLDY
jgi:hypothetical protein